MNQDTTRFCVFHFKMDLDMINKLKGLNLFSEAGNLSRLIVEIMTMLVPLMEKEHLSGKQLGNKYGFVHEKQDVKRVSTHVYMADGLYRRLKLMHQDLNCYSMAQLLRRFLAYFLTLVEEYGDGYQDALENLLAKCNLEIEKYQFSYEAVLQLLRLLNQKTKIIRLINIYNDKFSPVRIYRL